jgi:hypothetical protein
MQIIKLQVALYKSTLFCLICVVGNLCGLEFSVTHISFIPGEVTPCQIKNHVQRKFATPILYAIDIFKIYDFFSLHT